MISNTRVTTFHQFESRASGKLLRRWKADVTPDEKARLKKTNRQPGSIQSLSKRSLLWNQRAEASLRRALSILTRQLHWDPSYAKAYSANRRLLRRLWVMAF